MILYVIALISFAQLFFSFKLGFGVKFFPGHQLPYDLLKEEEISYRTSLQRLYYLIDTKSVTEDVASDDLDRSNRFVTSSTLSTRSPSSSDSLASSSLSSNTDFIIREASVRDLGAVAHIRVNVFYPEV